MRFLRLLPATARILYSLAVGSLCLRTAQVPAYGDDDLLTDPGSAILFAPAGDFEVELSRIVPASIPPFTASEPSQGETRAAQSARVELTELTDALVSVPPAQKDPVIAAYARARAQIDALKGSDYEHLQGHHGAATLDGEKLARELPVLPGMSDEYAEHLHALADYYSGRPTAARKRWEQLLDHPPVQRSRRTLWAAYMIGKSWLEEDAPADAPDQPASNAVAWFEKVRALGHQAYPDPIGLAASSLGWEALAESRLHHAHRAVELYVQAYQALDSNAYQSLLLLCHDWLDLPGGPPEEVTSDLLAARVVTAYIVAEGTKFHSRPKPDVVRNWIKRVAPIEREVGVDRLGWAAYQMADDASASRLLALAPAQEPMSLWMRAKLAVKANELDKAMTLFESAAAAWPRDEVWHDTRSGFRDTVRGGQWIPYRIWGELGAMELSRGSYERALLLMVWAKRDQDAAYIAECVMTTDELISFSPKAGRDSALQNMLARRLTREGRWKEARPYYENSSDRVRLDAYVNAIRAGHDAESPDDDRADAFWRAALIAREQGIALFGHDTDPSDRGIVYFRLSGKYLGILGSSVDERKRVAPVAPRFFSRLEATQIAGDHAWQAACLLPDESDETARVLCRGGNWLLNWNPPAAMKFYRALVDRCGTTKLGREAATLNHLPPAASALLQ